MNRLEQLRITIDGILMAQQDAEERRCGFVHLYGVAIMCALLAEKRGLDVEIASAAGMLHDIYSYRTGLQEFHAHNSEEDARVILRDTGAFATAEQELIRSAIFHHSDKGTVHQTYDELLKDADVLQHYLYNTKLSIKPHERERLRRLHAELGLPSAPEAAPLPETDTVAEKATVVDRRARLAEIAEVLAKQPLIGNDHQSGEDLWPLLRYFPGATLQVGFDWCAAFVYHCCRQAGFILPIKHPAPVPCRFAGVPAWIVWAQLPDNLFYTAAGDTNYDPERGDIVVYDRMVSDDPHDHIGIVLSYENSILTTAEGNVDNRSGIFLRDVDHHVNGFIRIDNAYQYGR